MKERGSDVERIKKRIANSDTTDMPGTDYPRPGYKITCAMEEAVTSRSGKKTKLHRVGDHVRITRFDKGRKRYQTDRELQKALGEYVAQHGGDREKPMRVPIILTSDEAGEVLFRRMAMYRGGGQPVCTCEEFALKDAAMLEEQGIPLPSKQEGNLGREYFAGVYTRRKYHPETHKRVGIDTGLCDPASCPFASGGEDDYKDTFKSTYGYWPDSNKVGDVLCRPQIVFTCVIAELAQGRNPVAVLRSKSWNTGSQLSYWLEEMQEATGGILRGIPLWLILEFQQSQDRDGQTHIIPVWTLAPRRFAWPELPEAGSQIQQQRLQAAKYHEEARALLEGDVKGLPAGKDFVEEFWPEVDGESGEADIQDQVEWLARDVLDWSGSEVSDLLDRCEETGEWEQEERRLSDLAENRAEKKAEEVDIEPEGEVDESEPEPEGPADIPCPDDLSMFPTDRKEWADGLKASGWDADALKGALEHTEYGKLPDITDETDPSSLWPVMVAINWYAHEHDLQDPLQPLFDEVETAPTGDSDGGVVEGDFEEQLPLEEDTE